MAASISNILASIFFALAFIWFVIAVSYAASVVLFLKMRREGRFHNVRFNDPEFGRYYLCGTRRLYLPMGWIFRRFILQYQNEQERRCNNGRVMNKAERRLAMEHLLNGMKTTNKTPSPPPKESIAVVDMDTSADTSSSSESDTETADGEGEDHYDVATGAGAPGDIEACCEVSSVTSSSNNNDSEHDDDDMENVCCICLGRYDVDSNQASEESWASPVCKHQFHRECLLAWLEQPGKTECPCCRKDIVEEDRVWKAVKQLRRTRRKNNTTTTAAAAADRATQKDADAADVAGDPESPSSLEANNVEC